MSIPEKVLKWCEFEGVLAKTAYLRSWEKPKSLRAAINENVLSVWLLRMFMPE